MSKFGSGADKARRESGGDFIELTLLPDAEKERLCRELLSEFGVTSVKANDKGELIHSCCLPFAGMHAHGDRNPSASLNYKRLTYNCYSCGGGGLLWFIGTCRGTSSIEARRWLGSETGTGADEQTLASLLEFFDAVYAQRPDLASPIPKMNPKILEPYRAIHPYMTEVRQIPEDVLMEFSVGYGEFRINLGDRDSPRWVTSPRVVIPHFWKDELVGWQSRRLLEDGTPKYQNTTDFPRLSTLYNYAPAEHAVVVESTMSVLRHVRRHPFVATFGAEITDKQIRYLALYPKVTLWFDNDNAGWKATEQVGEALSAYSSVYSVESPWAADAADMDADTVDGLLDEAVPFSIWSRPSSLDPWEG